MDVEPSAKVICGPFGSANLLETVPAHFVENMYYEKCGAEVDFSRIGVKELLLYECETTGVRFWRPAELAGDEQFYQHLESKWPFYYRDWRWEYGPALKVLRDGDRILEIGCGRGYFLKHTEGRAGEGLGLELNREAVAGKVTGWPVEALTIEDLARKQRASFDTVFSFQVLEHVVDPASFISAAINCLKPGGLLVLSTPDPDNKALQERRDAFDLPPHHMNHISEASYHRIARLYDLRIVRFDRAPLIPWGSRPPGQPRTASLVARGNIALRNLAARIIGRRGPTLMVILRKLHTSPC